MSRAEPALQQTNGAAMGKTMKFAAQRRNLDAAAHDRPSSWCRSCGYYRVAHGRHRSDCAIQRVSIAEHLRAVAIVMGTLGGRIVADTKTDAWTRPGQTWRQRRHGRVLSPRPMNREGRP
jgi:hypothetical protein